MCVCVCVGGGGGGGRLTPPPSLILQKCSYEKYILGPFLLLTGSRPFTSDIQSFPSHFYPILQVKMAQVS